MLLVTLFHASFNTAGVLLPIANNLSNANMYMRAIISTLELLVAVIVALTSGPARLSRTEEKQVELEQNEATSHSRIYEGVLQ